MNEPAPIVHIRPEDMQELEEECRRTAAVLRQRDRLSLEDGAKLGRNLTRIRQHKSKGEWGPFLVKILVSERMAERYMEVATLNDYDLGECSSLREALEMCKARREEDNRHVSGTGSDANPSAGGTSDVPKSTTPSTFPAAGQTSSGTPGGSQPAVGGQRPPSAGQPSTSANPAPEWLCDRCKRIGGVPACDPCREKAAKRNGKPPSGGGGSKPPKPPKGFDLDAFNQWGRSMIRELDKLAHDRGEEDGKGAVPMTEQHKAWATSIEQVIKEVDKVAKKP
jgi:hypothetical protein